MISSGKIFLEFSSFRLGLGLGILLLGQFKTAIWQNTKERHMTSYMDDSVVYHGMYRYGIGLVTQNLIHPILLDYDLHLISIVVFTGKC